MVARGVCTGERGKKRILADGGLVLQWRRRGRRECGEWLRGLKGPALGAESMAGDAVLSQGIIQKPLELIRHRLLNHLAPNWNVENRPILTQFSWVHGRFFSIEA